jgi:response regulator RpfG family c-di-GMP phosphodiesterase
MSGLVETGPVLIVDDDPHVREMLHELFRSDGYQCQVAVNGREALDVFTTEHPPLTVTDVKMPIINGLEFLEQAQRMDPDAMVLVLTGVGDVRTAVESLTGGAYDFIVKPVNPTQLLHAAERALKHRRLLIERREHVALLESHVAEATRELDVMLHHLEDTYRSTLEALGSAIDTRDVGTHSHSRRVRGYTLLIARAHGVPEPALGDLERGVLLHDIGKIGIPDAILFKPGPLTPDEWKIMQRHPDIGRQLIEKIPFLHGAVPIVYHHHEQWDGTGYPLGLRGEAIPLGARVFAVADTFDAMTFDRPYSKAVSFQTARQEIRRCAGTHFDPAVVATFLTIPVHLLVAIQRVSTEEPD